MRNVKKKNNAIEGLSLLFEVICPVFEMPCAECGGQGGCAAVTETGDDQDFAIPACVYCAKWSPVFKNRAIYYVMAA